MRKVKQKIFFSRSVNKQCCPILCLDFRIVFTLQLYDDFQHCKKTFSEFISNLPSIFLPPYRLSYDIHEFLSDFFSDRALMKF